MNEQWDKFKKLSILITENPELRILPMVYHEIIGEDYSYWSGSWGRAEIDEVYSSDERIYFKSEDEEELVETYADNFYDDMFPDVMQLSDEQAELVYKKAIEAVENLDWERVIAVRIEMP